MNIERYISINIHHLVSVELLVYILYVPQTCTNDILIEKFKHPSAPILLVIMRL